jgi:head-tail adaptor
MLQSNTRIAELDREITFIQPVISNGTSNEDKITGWQELETDPTVNAKKIEGGGNTLVQNDRITFSQQTTWVIRWRNDLTISMRLVWDTKVYSILNVSELDEGRQRFLSVQTNLLDNEYFT